MSGTYAYTYTKRVDYAEHLQRYLTATQPNLLYIVSDVGTNKVTLYFRSPLNTPQKAKLDSSMLLYMNTTSKPFHPKLERSYTVSNNDQTDFRSLDTALTYASTHSPCTINILAGTYQLSNSITVPEDVTLESNDGNLSTFLVFSVNNVPAITLQGNSSISGLCIRAPRNQAVTGLSFDNLATSPAYVQNCRLQGMTIGVKSNNSTSTLHLHKLEIGGGDDYHVDYGVVVTSGADVHMTETLISGVSMSMSAGIWCDGLTTSVVVQNSLIRYTNVGLLIDGGKCRLSASRMFMNGRAVEVSERGTINTILNDIVFEDSTDYAVNVLTPSPNTCNISISGCMLHDEQINNPYFRNIVSSLVVPKTDKTLIKQVEGQIQLGNTLTHSPFKVVVGKGTPAKANITLQSNTFLDSGTWTVLSSDDQVSKDIFASSQAQSSFYIGVEGSPFVGLVLYLTRQGSNNTYLWEYWNGETWSETGVMCLTGQAPWQNYGNNIVTNPANAVYYVFLGSTPDWEALTLNGTTRYYMRIRTKETVSVIPQIQLLEPILDGTIVEQDGTMLRFGTSQVQKMMSFECKTSWKQMTFSSIEMNWYASNMIFPDNICTAYPIILEWTWTTDAPVTVASEVVWEVTHAVLKDQTEYISFDADAWFSTSADQATTSIQNVAPSTNTKNYRSQVKLNVNGAIPAEDMFAFQIMRRASDVNDTLPSTVVLMSCYIRYISCVEGASVGDVNRW